MRPRTKYKSARLNFLVTLICLSVCAGSIWIFYKDFTSSSSRSDMTSIASISYKYKIAQRKYSDRVVWERLQQNSPIYEGDTIHTADLAQATIRFNEGTSLEIGENTMVQISLSKDGAVRLSVTGGNVDVDTTNSSGAVELEMGNGMVVNLDSGSKISARLNEDGDGAGLKIQAGNAKIQGEDGALSAGESVKINENGVKKAPVTVTSISDNYRVLVFEENKSSAEVPIEWFPLDDSKKKVVIQTSTKKDFSTIKNTYTAVDSNKIKIPAEDGTIYWRAFTEGEEVNATEGKISFDTVSPVVATYPENEALFSYFKEKPNINFAWRGNAHSAKYKFEIDNDSEFKNPKVSQELSGQTFNVSNLDEGKYYWRVTPYYETNKIGWYGETETKSFEITRREELMPPTLMFPMDGKKLSYMGNARNATVDANFSWKSENVDSNYVLQISSDKDFKNVVYKKLTDSKSIHDYLPISEFPDGDYYWNITQNATVDGEKATFVSEVRKFTVEKFVPQQNKLLYPDDTYSVERGSLASVNFIWRISSENEALYEEDATKIQFATTKDFSNPIYEEETNDSSIKNVNLKPGKYYWRIKKGDSTTEPRMLTVLGNLKRPELTSLKNNETIAINRNVNSIKFNWEKVDGADFYKVKVYESDSNKLISEISEITDESFEIPLENENISSKAKTFKIQVQAFTNETKQNAARKSEVAESKISVRLVSPVKLLSPALNSQLNGLTSIMDGVTLKWTKGDDAYSSAALKLWRVDAGGKLTLIENIKNPKETVNIPRVPEGNYRWTVTATNKNNLLLDAEEIRDFTVKRIPELERAVLTSPEKNQKIDAAYLKKNRSISFSWKAVEGATEYDFVLFQKLSNGKLKKIYEIEHQKSTQIKIKKLEIFDIGNFQWQVTASNCAKDGFVYQKGKIATGEFKIDFSLPGKIETLDSGVMYGE